MSEPTVAIVLLNYNTFDWTTQCIQSLAGLQYRSWRLIVVDNASADGSADRLQAAHPDLRLLRSASNLGFAGGCNLGVRVALAEGADLIWLLNTDTRVEPTTLGEMVAAMQADPRLGAVGSVIMEMDAPQQVQCWGGGRYSLWSGYGHALRRPGELHYITGTSLLARADALRQVGLLDEGYFFYFEDTDLGFRLRRAGWKLAVAPRARVWHATSKSVGQGSSRQGRLWTQSLVRFMRTHAPLPCLPAVSAAVAKALLDLTRGRWRSVLGQWQGWRDGWRQPLPPTRA